MQKVHRNFGFAKAILILDAGNTTKASELTLNEAMTLNKKVHDNRGDRIEEAADGVNMVKDKLNIIHCGYKY